MSLATLIYNSDERIYLKALFFIFTDTSGVISDFSQSGCFQFFNKELNNFLLVMYFWADSCKCPTFDLGQP